MHACTAPFFQIASDLNFLNQDPALLAVWLRNAQALLPVALPTDGGPQP